MKNLLKLLALPVMFILLSISPSSADNYTDHSYFYHPRMDLPAMFEEDLWYYKSYRMPKSKEEEENIYRWQMQIYKMTIRGNWSKS